MTGRGKTGRKDGWKNTQERKANKSFKNVLQQKKENERKKESMNEQSYFQFRMGKKKEEKNQLKEWREELRNEEER